jgi:hypothetical protein
MNSEQSDVQNKNSKSAAHKPFGIPFIKPDSCLVVSNLCHEMYPGHRRLSIKSARNTVGPSSGCQSVSDRGADSWIWRSRGIPLINLTELAEKEPATSRD